MTLGGYLDVRGGRYGGGVGVRLPELFYDGVTGTTACDINGLIGVLENVADIAAFVQEDAAASGPPG